jgi:hypothetical protein
MVSEISLYLKSANPSFEEGFALFCKYSHNRNLIDWINRRNDKATLLYQLKKLNNLLSDGAPINTVATRLIRQPKPTAKIEKTAAKSEAPKVTFKTYDDRRTKRSDLSPEMQKVYDDVASEYSVRRGYHEKMKMAKTDADRQAFRAKILESEERIKSGWARIDAWLAENESKKVTDDFKESTCRSYISKALKSKNVTDDLKIKVHARLTALQEHGCEISANTMKALKKKAFI